MPDLIHVHDHQDQCVFCQAGQTGDFTAAELDAAMVSGTLRQGDVELPASELGMLRVRDDWDGPGASNAGTWLSLYDATGVPTHSPQGLRRGAVLMPPQAFLQQAAWERVFGVGVYQLEPVALTALRDPTVLTWGFELETQRSAGGDRSGHSPEVLEPEAWVETHATDSEDHLTRDAIDNYVRNHAPALLRGEPTVSLREAVRDWLRGWVQLNGIPRTPLRDWLRRQFQHLPLQVGEDGTVQGFEFRTRGGLTAEQFETTARAVLSLPHEVDTGCSFHIHCKLPGARLGYSQEFHRHLTEWLACHVDEMPEPVLSRLASSARDRWFAPRLDENKYRAVHCHPEFETWEFRLFGNVASADDALKCRQLAERAVLHALKVAARQAEPLLAETNVETLQRIYQDAFTSGRRPAAARRVA